MPLLHDLLQWRAALPERLPRRRRMLIHPAEFDELRRGLHADQILNREEAAQLLRSDFSLEVVVEESCPLGYVILISDDTPAWMLPAAASPAPRQALPPMAARPPPPKRESLWERLEEDGD